MNPDCSIVYLMASSRLLINCLSSPEKMPTAAVTGLCGMAKGGVRPEAEDDGLARPEADDDGPAKMETEDKRAGKTLDSYTCNRQ